MRSGTLLPVSPVVAAAFAAVDTAVVSRAVLLLHADTTSSADSASVRGMCLAAVVDLPSGRRHHDQIAGSSSESFYEPRWQATWLGP
jgi:hypothetical protein